MGVTVNENRALCNSATAPASAAAAAVPVLVASLLALLAATAAADPGTGDYVIEVSKSKQQLRVLYADQTVRSYHISYGKGGTGTKMRRGDNKTPIGSYRIVDFNDDSRFFMFMQLDYPNMRDGWHGYRNRLISATEFKAIATAFRDGQSPPQDTALGGFIGIHGIGEDTNEKREIHRKQNWTEGCIALRNEEVDELRRFVKVGTRVVIHE